MLPIFRDHVLMVSFVQSLFVVLMTWLSAVCKYLQIWFKNFKRIFLTKMGRENREKKVVVKDLEKTFFIYLNFF